MATTIGAKMIEVRVPQLFPTHTVRETLIIERWYVQEGDILEPDALMVSLETPPGFFDIPAPPEVIAPYYVKHIYVSQGGTVRLNELLVRLEPVAESE